MILLVVTAEPRHRNPRTSFSSPLGRSIQPSRRSLCFFAPSGCVFFALARVLGRAVSSRAGWLSLYSPCLPLLRQRPALPSSSLFTLTLPPFALGDIVHSSLDGRLDSHNQCLDLSPTSSTLMCTPRLQFPARRRSPGPSDPSLVRPDRTRPSSTSVFLSHCDPSARLILDPIAGRLAQDSRELGTEQPGIPARAGITALVLPARRSRVQALAFPAPGFPFLCTGVAMLPSLSAHAVSFVKRKGEAGSGAGD